MMNLLDELIYNLTQNLKETVENEKVGKLEELEKIRELKNPEKLGKNINNIYFVFINN